MSAKAHVAAIQSILHTAGLYRGTIDGDPGPLTNEAWRSLSVLAKTEGVAPIPVGPTSALGLRLCDIAAGEVGTKEVGENGGPRIREYQAATWLAPGAWPWCAAFICWLLKKAAALPFEAPRTAGAWDFERWAREQASKGVRLLKPRQSIQRGDIVIFTFSHIGLCVGGERAGIINTIEGNTDAGGGREGDGVYAKTREVRLVRSHIRFA